MYIFTGFPICCMVVSVLGTFRFEQIRGVTRDKTTLVEAAHLIAQSEAFFVHAACHNLVACGFIVSVFPISGPSVTYV